MKQQILVINDNESTSVNYSKADIDSGFNPIPYIVADLLADKYTRDGFMSIYNDILELHQKYGYIYKPASFNEMGMTIDKIARLSAISIDILWIDISWIDTSEFIKVILEDGSEKTIDMINKKSDNIEFLKITTPELSAQQSDILIHKNWNIDIEATHWLPNNIMYLANLQKLNNEEDAANDLDGYGNCQKIIDKFRCYQKNYYESTQNIDARQMLDNTDFVMRKMSIIIPAVWYACSDKKDINGRIFNGYLPSAGQLHMLMQNIVFMGYLLLYIGFEDFSFKSFPLITFATSTEKNETDIWSVRNNYADLMPMKKTLEYLSVMTFYREKEDA